MKTYQKVIQCLSGYRTNAILICSTRLLDKHKLWPGSGLGVPSKNLLSKSPPSDALFIDVKPLKTRHLLLISTEFVLP